VFCATGSPLVGCGSSPRTDGLGWREAVIRTYHPWRIARAPLGPPMSPLGTMMTPEWPSRLPLLHFNVDSVPILFFFKCHNETWTSTRMWCRYLPHAPAHSQVQKVVDLQDSMQQYSCCECETRFLGWIVQVCVRSQRDVVHHRDVNHC